AGSPQVLVASGVRVCCSSTLPPPVAPPLSSAFLHAASPAAPSVGAPPMRMKPRRSYRSARMRSMSVMPPPSSFSTFPGLDDAVSCAEPRNRATFAGGQPLHGRIAQVGIAAPLLVAALRGSPCASKQPTSTTPSGTTGPTHVLEPIPPRALPGESADPPDLDAASIASDAVDVAALEGLLDRAGFVGGTQRQFSRVRNGRRRILARVLMFQTP